MCHRSAGNGQEKGSAKFYCGNENHNLEGQLRRLPLCDEENSNEQFPVHIILGAADYQREFDQRENRSLVRIQIKIPVLSTQC